MVRTKTKSPVTPAIGSTAFDVLKVYEHALNTHFSLGVPHGFILGTLIVSW